MTKVLCWEERSNGRCCKNYRLTGKDKCKNHYIENDNGLQSFILFVLTSYFMGLCILVYFGGDNGETIDDYMYSMKSFIVHSVKEPIKLALLELYKNYPLYMNNISMYFSKILN